MTKRVETGDFGEFGAQYRDGGVCFTYTVKTLSDTAVCLYRKSTQRLCARIEVPKTFSRGHVISVFVTGYDWDSLCYLYDKDGELSVDPYARRIVGRERWMNARRYRRKFRVFGGFDTDTYEWKHESPALLDSETVIYKAHIRGVSMLSGVPVRDKGNYRGFLELLPAISDMGFSAVLFFPLYEFEEMKYPSRLSYSGASGVVTEVGKPQGTNFWGYGEGNYFAPKASYFGETDETIHLKETIDAIHGRGMEAYMEIATGQGKTDPDLILSMLRFWVREYRIDGFRLLGLDFPIERIVTDPYLAETRFFYDSFPMEYLLGETGKKRLFVYNDQFLYPLRRLQNHFDGNVAEFSGVFKRQESTYGYVNYPASNNGFTLMDTYSYGEKHNEANGEENRDGNNYNCSFNHGFEGASKNNAVRRARYNCVRAALALTFLAQGIPLICAGDEYGNTQRGNNNPYNQDNSVGWVIYQKSMANDKLKKYVSALIDFRSRHPVLSQSVPMQMNDYLSYGLPDLSYHGREPWIMGIGEEKKAVGILYNGDYAAPKPCEDVMICVNFYYGEETFALPALYGGRKWYYVTNTSEDEFTCDTKPYFNQREVIVPGGTVTILAGRGDEAV